MQPSIRRFALLGNFSPRQCGIATFTSDLEKAISAESNNVSVDVVAVSDKPDYQYSDKVRKEIVESDKQSYVDAAKFLNRGNYEVLSVQHEYGIYGGTAGKYLMNLVRAVKMPIVTTLHTVLQDPSPAQREVMDELLQLSERVVVMSHRAIDFLKQVHGVRPEKIDMIPHGIPDISRVDGSRVRQELNIAGSMILTFGLLSPDKGIETMIAAMPKILEQNPDAVYVIVGATHPNIRATVGEKYRESLIDLAERLGVLSSIRLVDRFVSKDELNEYLSAMDVYVTPYLNPKQITSGTLAYAVGAGKAVVSTPYWYAEELLADGRGMLVPFRDPEALSGVMNQILGSQELRNQLGYEAATFGKNMLWSAVGRSYISSFEKAEAAGRDHIRLIVEEPATRQLPPREALPDINLEHLTNMTDDTGLIQHATYAVPNRAEGYCVDDNARSLIFTVCMEDSEPLFPHLRMLQKRYLAFVLDSYNPNSQRFRNFMSYDRRWLEESGSDDSQGRTLWSLGAVAGHARDKASQTAAQFAFKRSMGIIDEINRPRPWAYSILGADEFLSGPTVDPEVQAFLERTANRLLAQYEANASDYWPWFESSLTYGNARLSEALIVAGDALNDQKMLTTGLESLRWLMGVQTNPEEDIFIPIGSLGFYERGGLRSFYDQQPIEAASTVSACLSALRITQDPKWARDAERTFGWFLGKNTLGVPVCQVETGACYDGIHPDRLNSNQGAESTLSYLTALCQMKDSAMARSVIREQTRTS